MTPSRRTGPAGLALLRERLGGLPARSGTAAASNPYYAYLALADALLVTADLVSMVSEAAATASPCMSSNLPGGNAKFARFHAAMRDAGITRPFAGRIETWTYPIPDDTERAGAMLRSIVLDAHRREAGGVRGAAIYAGLFAAAIVLALLAPELDVAASRHF